MAKNTEESKVGQKKEIEENKIEKVNQINGIKTWQDMNSNESDGEKHLVSTQEQVKSKVSVKNSKQYYYTHD